MMQIETASLLEASSFQLRGLNAQMRIVLESFGVVGDSSTVRRADLLETLAHRVIGVVGRHAGIHPALRFDDLFEPAEHQIGDPLAGLILVLPDEHPAAQQFRRQLPVRIGVDAHPMSETSMLLTGAHRAISLFGRHLPNVHPSDEFLLEPRLGEVILPDGITLGVEEENPGLGVPRVFNHHL